MKHHDRKASWGRKGFFRLLFHSTEGSQDRNPNRRQELMQGPRRDAACWLAPYGLLMSNLHKHYSSMHHGTPPCPQINK
ncbi:hypothetical protein ACRRTK_005556 [Alexandromys fortis]